MDQFLQSVGEVVIGFVAGIVIGVSVVVAILYTLYRMINSFLYGNKEEGIVILAIATLLVIYLAFRFL